MSNPRRLFFYVFKNKINHLINGFEIQLQMGLFYRILSEKEKSSKNTNLDFEV